ncbi:MAG TPA: hypothetical protein VFU78_10590 [Thermomicrobiales bacterium]|nr:hypothetical protein [Thermomicrobiales bacterium]
MAEAMNQRGFTSRQSEDFLLVFDFLPLRLRDLATTELPATAAAIADTAAALAARGAALGRIAYILAEHDWDLSVAGGFLLTARRTCRRIEVERLLSSHADLAILATVYIEDGRHELFWAEDESRLVAA